MMLLNSRTRSFHTTYNAAGQQVSVDWTDLKQWYDGDRLRVKKTEDPGDTPTYYLRSSVLGGQVVAEINAAGSLQRGYVYGAGGGLLAILSGGVSWVYQDAATKSQRLADSAGNVYAGVDVDPWGRETGRSWNSQAQPRRYTTYTRDANDSDEAMHRRSNRWHLRFDQPDPYDGSYDLSDPQSFNRYSYTDNDPVNFTDPTGLLPSMPDATQGWWYYGNGFWGYSEGRMRTMVFGHIITDERERRWWWGGVFTWEEWDGQGLDKPWQEVVPVVNPDSKEFKDCMQEFLEDKLESEFGRAYEVEAAAVVDKNKAIAGGALAGAGGGGLAAGEQMIPKGGKVRGRASSVATLVVLISGFATQIYNIIELESRTRAANTLFLDQNNREKLKAFAEEGYYHCVHKLKKPKPPSRR